MVKVAIIGAGFVGSTAAYSLMIDGLASEIALIDINKEKAKGEAMDLAHGMQFVEGTKISFGSDYKLCKNADIVVICAGAHQKPGMTRLDLINTNAKIFKSMIPKIVKHNKSCIFLIVSNPVDILTYLTIKYSGFPAERVFGSGTTLDTARFRHMLSQHFHVCPTSVHGFILGEHGDSSFPVWSTANIAGVPLKNLKHYNKKAMNKIYENTRKAAYEILARKGATYYAIGLVVTKLVRSIIKDRCQVYPVSTLLKNYHGVSGICLSVPSVIGKKGVKAHILAPMNPDEKKKLRNSAKVLKDVLRRVK